MIKKYLFVLIILTFLGCKFNSLRVNNNLDKNAALNVTDKFYMYFQNKNYSETFQFLNSV